MRDMKTINIADLICRCTHTHARTTKNKILEKDKTDEMWWDEEIRLISINFI